MLSTDLSRIQEVVMATNPTSSILADFADFLRDGDLNDPEPLLSAVRAFAVFLRTLPEDEVQNARSRYGDLALLGAIIGDETPYEPALGDLNIGWTTYRRGGKYSRNNQQNPIRRGDAVDKNLMKITTPKANGAGVNPRDLNDKQWFPVQPPQNPARRDMPYNVIKTLEFEVINRPDPQLSKAAHLCMFWGGHE
jgi:hypothetical protein